MSEDFMRKSLWAIFCVLLIGGCATPTYTPIIQETSQEQSSAEHSAVNAEEWRGNLETLSTHNQGREASAVFSDVNAAQALRDRAAYVLATRPDPMTLIAQQHLSRIYVDADLTKRAEMESILLYDVRTLPHEYLQELAMVVPRVQETNYPWNIIVLEAARNNLLVDSEGAIERLGQAHFYANPGILALGDSAGLTPVTSDEFGGLVINPHPRFTETCVTLLLPMTGSYGSIGTQIAEGANIAREAIMQTGVNVTVNIIDTETSSWISSLSVLPANCVVVGGPLRVSHMEQALEANVNTSKALFGFMSQLPSNAVEGSNAWRFFTSPQDQINSLLNFVSVELGISEIGTVYPNDSYGTRMTEIFEQVASSRSIFTTSYSYPLEDQTVWTDEIGSYLGSQERSGRLPLITAPVQAVFMPDSWNNMEMVASILHYQGAVYMPLLGTNLWEQSLVNATNLQTTYFKLAIFPAAWDSTSRSYGALFLNQAMMNRGGTANDWSALGYDFVQMASALDYSNQGFNASSLNQKLSVLQPLAWAGAPFSWDYAGRATRNLFLFQPDVNGMKPLNKEEYLTNMQQ